MTDGPGLAACALAVACAAGLAGCKGDPKPAGGANAAAPVAIDVAAINALVPAALKATLVFERREIVIERGSHKTTYAIAAPSGWIQSSKLFAHLRPAGGARTAPRFEIGANCDGPCTPRPWEAVADRVNFAPRAKGKVGKDERTSGRRTMIAEVEAAGERTTDVVVAWWADGDKRYHVCTAVLDDALKDAAAAFDKACQAVAITGDE